MNKHLPAEIAPQSCPNCGYAMETPWRYCPSCGQETITAREGMGAVFKSFLGDYFTFDSKIAASLKPLLLAPGTLTAEYIIGRRARYITPLRLYIFISIVFFLVLSSGTSSLPANVQVDDVFVWNEFFRTYLPRVFFLMLPIFAGISAMLFRKAERGYVIHLVFALHYHAFVFLVLTAYVLLSRVSAAAGWYQVNVVLLTLLSLWFLVYLFLALRRAFALPAGRTLLLHILLVLLYTLLATVTLLAIVGYVTFTQ